jgi:hypothetical protein
MGEALHIKSLSGGVGGGVHVSARLNADEAEKPETKM